MYIYIYIFWHIIAIFFCHADEDNKLLKIAILQGTYLSLSVDSYDEDRYG